MLLNLRRKKARLPYALGMRSIGEEIEIEFNVIDTGKGISPEDKKRLFKRFSQANASIADNFGGSGLGLVFVNKLLTLWVETFD